GIRDVAISGGRIAAVAPNLPAERARKAISVAGSLVTPGLVDIHVHAYGGYSGWLFPDEHALPNGTTTVVDTGSAGWKSFEEFKTTIIDFRPQPERSYEELILKHMRPGDIHTHMYAAHIPLLDESGRVQEFAWEARRRGVIFDVGHGAGSFWFRRAVPAVEHGFIPDSISTDMHKYSILIPQATMPFTMSKMLNIGMPLREVILRSTVTPAREINRPELGTLSPGAG